MHNVVTLAYNVYFKGDVKTVVQETFCLKEERKEYQESELLCPHEIVFNHSNRLTNIISSPFDS